MIYHFIVETNVLVTANGAATHAGVLCEESCIRKLLSIRDTGVIVLDDDGEILTEYRKYCSHSGQPGVGDHFFRYVYDHQANQNICRKVKLFTNEDRKFAEFPDDPALNNFDLEDRKFVAVAIACNSIHQILNATDSDWALHQNDLRKYVTIVQLCPLLMPNQIATNRRKRVSRNKKA